MLVMLTVLLFLLCNGFIVYSFPRRWIWLVANYLLVVVTNYFGMLNVGVMWFLTGLLITITLIFYISPIRIYFLSTRIRQWVRKRLPSISATEAEVLKTGDHWMEASLFRGKPDWQWLADLKLSQLNAEELSFLNNETQIFCAMINDWQVIHQDHDLSPVAWQYLKDKGFCGLTIDKRYGGKGFSAAAVSAIVQKIASCSFTAGVTVMVPNSLGLGELFSHFGTDVQKEEYLPALATGKHLACFALTGPETGSDAASIPDIGIVCYEEFQEKKTLGVKITFDKRYITLAPVATLVGLAFRLVDPDHLLNGKGSEGITCCYLPRQHPGLIIGKRHYPCGMPIMNGPVQGKEVFIPIDWIVGGQAMAGRGWSILMSAISTGRSISLPAISQGLITLHYLTSSAYAAIRTQFGLPLGQFEGVQQVLATIAGLTFLSEACRVLTYTAVDHGIKPAVASAITKYHNTEISRKIINDVLDIHAGRGVMDGPRNYLTGHYCGLLISIPGEGANIMTRNLIIFSQAMTRCHPYIFNLITTAAQPDINNFDKVFWKSLGYSFNNMARLSALLLLRTFLIKPKFKDYLAVYEKRLTFLSSVFAVISDITIALLGGELKRKEAVSACLADMLSCLYLGASVIKQAASNNFNKVTKLHASWALEYCSVQFQEACFELFHNYPNKIVAGLLRVIVFPMGRKYKKPSHKLNKQLAELMQTDNSLRQYFSKQVYVAKNNVTTVESAFMSQLAVKEISNKLLQALASKQINRKSPISQQLQEALTKKLLTAAEVFAYQEFRQQYWQALKVDAFDKSLQEVDKEY
ncbi:MAG: hypothetical protein A3E87_06895 [Gammaproteobacteria bacterium RIFCSPHIGHO2_12_FULL_35_23]|nr:MAG: hypothetical protein A3E87_06895 [Gammaproteobacteria bacterium RIFCSPHIGHO2_12_FULL_35_23]